jgi:hypothetical protein
MPRARKLDVVGLAEAAELLGLSPNGLSARRGRPQRDLTDARYAPPLPKPVAELRCGPIWRRRQILEYAAEIKRVAGMTFMEKWNEENPDRFDGEMEAPRP